MPACLFENSQLGSSSFVLICLGVPLAYIFPAMFHYKTHPDRKSRIVSVSLLIFGTVTMIYTTGTTAYEWLQK